MSYRAAPIFGVEGRAPDAILSDFRFENGDRGMAAIITGDTTIRDLHEFGAGNRRVLHKPVSPSRLRVALAALLGGAGQGGMRYGRTI